jgi:ABC-type enterobactin transport system permease subunit
VAPAVALAGLVALLAGAAVTAVVSAAAGGVHFAVVVTPAVAVSFTEVTEVAFEATAIWASMLTVLLVVTEPMLHEAVPSPLAQPLLKVGF